MTDEAQILTTLEKLVETQVEALSLQRQTIENQQKALAQNQANMAAYEDQIRRQKIVQMVGVLLLAFLFYKLFTIH